MKKVYECPNLRIIAFDMPDVLTASNPGNSIENVNNSSGRNSMEILFDNAVAMFSGGTP